VQAASGEIEEKGEQIMNESLSPVACEALPEASQHTHRFKFTGDASEYFGIWIVNLFLSIVTLGIYSPWAKVRKKRYFYGHTWVADSNFEYHGNPIAILKGRIIALLALAFYSGAGYYSPRVAQGILIVLALLAPWLIARSMAFNAFNSSYREIRFHFKASYRDVLMAIWPFIAMAIGFFFLPQPSFDEEHMPTPAEWAVVFLPLLVVLLIYPYIMGAIKRLQVNHSSYGSTPLAISATIGQFYRLYIVAFAIAILGLFVLILTIATMAFIPIIGWVAIPFVYLFFGALYMGYLRSRVTNLTFSSTTLGGRVQFISSMMPMSLAKIYFINLVVISFTLGLMIPWAAVRVARYRASVLALESSGDLDSFVAEIGQQVAATGEEMGEFFDVDLSL
jgi:uncharacterized membrane protein YjgN (DUF898 family)